MNVLLRCVLLSPALLVSIAALAQQGGIRVENAWSRPAMQGGTGVVYLTITDSGAPDRLTTIAAPVATKAELHESFTEQGVAKMRGVATLPMVPGTPVTLAPGGYHIMLMGLKQQLKEGDSFPVTLSFDHSVPVTATVTVRRMSGAVPKGGDAMGGMPMPGRTP
jgi:hypothetical protein